MNFKLLSLALLSVLLTATDHAASRGMELTIGSFGTVQYTQSSSDRAYLRFADKEGTLKTNTIAGIQLDARFNGYWRAAVQGAASPKKLSDRGVEATTRWAYIAFAPNDVFDFRLGRQRLGLFMDSETLEVGHTYAQANLSPEVYFNFFNLSYDGFSTTVNLEADNGLSARLNLKAGLTDFVTRNPDTNPAVAPRFRQFKNSYTQGYSLELAYEDFRFFAADHTIDGQRDRTRAVLNDPSIDLQTTQAVDFRFKTIGVKYDWRQLGVRYERSSFSYKETFYADPGQELIASLVPSGFFGPNFDGQSAQSLNLTWKFNRQFTGYTGYYSLGDNPRRQYSLAMGGQYKLNANQSIKAEAMRVYVTFPTQELSDSNQENTEFSVFSLSHNWAF